MKTKKIFDKLIETNKNSKVASALCGVLYEDSLDMRINVIGAMQTSGWLNNRLKPYYENYNHNTEAWISKCIQRIIENDFDDYALAALLNCDINLTLKVCKFYGFKVIAIEKVNSKCLSLNFAQNIMFPNIISKVLSLSWEVNSNKIVDIVTIKALIADETFNLVNNQIVGKCTGSYFIRATLPFGYWNMPVSNTFEFYNAPLAILTQSVQESILFFNSSIV